MKKRIQLLVLSFRGISGLYGIPIIVVLLIAPIASYLFISQHGLEPSLPTIASFFQIAIPISPVFWLMGVLREYIEGDGNEILFIYQQAGRTRIIEVVLLIVWYVLHISLLFVILSGYYSFAKLESIYLRIVIQSLFFASFFYLLAYMIRSISMVLLAVLSYYFMTAFYAQDSILEKLSIFQFPHDLEIAPISALDCNILMCSLIFLIAGFFLNRRETK